MDIRILTSHVILDCREKIEYSHSHSSLENNEKFIGIVYEPDGRYQKYYLKSGLDNLVKFICSSDKDKLITDGNDYAVLNTMGKFIDHCIPTVNINELITVLTHYQEDYNINTAFEIFD